MSKYNEMEMTDLDKWRKKESDPDILIKIQLPEDKRQHKLWVDKMASGECMDNLPEEFKTESFFSEVVRVDGNFITSVPDEFLTPQISLEALGTSPSIFRHIKDDYKNEDFCVQAIELTNGEVIGNLPEEMLKSEKVIKALFKIDYKTIKPMNTYSFNEETLDYWGECRTTQAVIRKRAIIKAMYVGAGCWMSTLLLLICITGTFSGILYGFYQVDGDRVGMGRANLFLWGALVFGIAYFVVLIFLSACCLSGCVYISDAFKSEKNHRNIISKKNKTCQPYD